MQHVVHTLDVLADLLSCDVKKLDMIPEREKLWREADVEYRPGLPMVYRATKNAVLSHAGYAILISPIHPFLFGWAMRNTDGPLMKYRSMKVKKLYEIIMSTILSKQAQTPEKICTFWNTVSTVEWICYIIVTLMVGSLPQLDEELGNDLYWYERKCCIQQSILCHGHLLVWLLDAVKVGEGYQDTFCLPKNGRLYLLSGSNYPLNKVKMTPSKPSMEIMDFFLVAGERLCHYVCVLEATGLVLLGKDKKKLADI